MVAWVLTRPRNGPRPSSPPRPAGRDFRLRGRIHVYDYVYEGWQTAEFKKVKQILKSPHLFSKIEV
jgi:hypothetical protein